MQEISLKPRRRTLNGILSYNNFWSNDNVLTRDSIMIEMVATFDEAANAFFEEWAAVVAHEPHEQKI